MTNVKQRVATMTQLADTIMKALAEGTAGKPTDATMVIDALVAVLSLHVSLYPEPSRQVIFADIGDKLAAGIVKAAFARELHVQDLGTLQ